ncbi:MAG: hypothetical protein F6J93_34215 [Oscillatoria sp. SIO1A7]|nr:hypothetical protein [Oscillatoria sp. SIO1A7]
MKEKLERRLESLKAEYEAGKKMLADLEAKEDSLRETLLRISGAIQVLEEMLGNIEKNDRYNEPEPLEPTEEGEPEEVWGKTNA